MKHVTLGVALLTMLSGCASYEQPDESAPHAKATFQRSAGTGGNIISQGRLLSYYVATNDECSEAPRVAFFGTGDFAGNQKSIRLRSGEVVKILAFLEVNDAGGFGASYKRTGQTRCTVEASFVPKEGQDYLIGLEVGEQDNECMLSVIDGASAVTPPDLTVDDNVCSSKPNTIPD